MKNQLLTLLLLAGYTAFTQAAGPIPRKIAVIAYGSLIKDPTGTKMKPKKPSLSSSEFAKIPGNITLPVSLTFLAWKNSENRKLTAAVDTEFGAPVTAYFARSHEIYLCKARENLAGREAAQKLSTGTYDLTNIPYLKKLFPGQAKDTNEARLAGTNNWVVRDETISRAQQALSSEQIRRLSLPVSTFKKLTSWADSAGYNTLIWTAYPNNIETLSEAQERMKHDPVLKKNTLEYINNLPEATGQTLKDQILGIDE